MKPIFILRDLRDETLAHLPVFTLGVLAGALLAALPLAAAGNTPEPVVAAPMQPEKSCAALWDTPFFELTTAEQATREQCDEMEVLLQREETLNDTMKGMP